MSTIKLVDSSKASGTSFHGTTIDLDPKKLFEVFGRGEESDGYKVSSEYTFEFDGDIFTLYDWKSTRLYDNDKTLPTPKQFWKQSTVELHIGSNQPSYKEGLFRMELEALLGSSVVKTLKAV